MVYVENYLCQACCLVAIEVHCFLFVTEAKQLLSQKQIYK